MGTLEESGGIPGKGIPETLYLSKHPHILIFTITLKITSLSSSSIPH